MTRNSAFRATVEYEIISNYNCPFSFPFFTRSSIFFFFLFLLKSLFFTQKVIEKIWNHTGKRQLSCKIAGDLFTNFYAVSYDYWLLIITYQIREKHFVRDQEYWNEDWNKSSNGEWTLQGINMGVLLSIWRREFLGIPFRKKFIIYMNFKPCHRRLFITTFKYIKHNV